MRLGTELKLLVIGHKRHGKDSVCNLLEAYGFTFTSSSEFINERVVYPVLKNKHGYTSPEECFNDRDNHRQEWYQLIHEYNTPDLTRLTREILKENSIYCGLRHNDEFRACQKQNLFDYVLWVDASHRCKLESLNSFTIPVSVADYIIDNNGGTESDLLHEVTHFITWLNTMESQKNRKKRLKSESPTFNLESV